MGALRNEEAAKLAAQRDAQTARHRVHQLEVGCLLPVRRSVLPCLDGLLKNDEQPSVGVKVSPLLTYQADLGCPPECQ